MFVKIIIPILAALGVASFFIPLGGSAQTRQPPRAPEMQLTSESLIHGLGLVEPEGEIFEVHAPQVGVIEEVHVAEGMAIEEGQVLFKLRDTNLKEKIESEKSYIKWLEQKNRAEWVDYRKADELYERVRRFDDGVVVSRDEVLRRKHERSRQEALVSASRKEIDYRMGLIKELEREADHLLVKSPVKGLVVSADLKPLQSARTVGKPHLRIAPEGRMVVRLQVSEKDAWRVSDRCIASFSIPGHQEPVTGRYHSRELEMKPRSSTNGIHEVVDSRVLEVKFVLDNENRKLPLVYGQQISGSLSCQS